jgi:hypothetical protein
MRRSIGCISRGVSLGLGVFPSDGCRYNWGGWTWKAANDMRIGHFGCLFWKWETIWVVHSVDTMTFYLSMRMNHVVVAPSLEGSFDFVRSSQVRIDRCVERSSTLDDFRSITEISPHSGKSTCICSIARKPRTQSHNQKEKKTRSNHTARPRKKRWCRLISDAPRPVSYVSLNLHNHNPIVP